MNRLLTLEDIMKRFRPESYASVVNALCQLTLVIEKEIEVFNADHAVQGIYTDLKWLSQGAAFHGLGAVKASTDRLITLLEADAPGRQYAVAKESTYLRQAMLDELHQCLFIELEPDRVPFAFEPHRFGEQVDKAFPSAAWDIEEAARCLAFDRWTAAVFHLSRVAELVAVAIGKDVGYQSHAEQFSECLKYIENKLNQAKTDYASADPRFKGRTEFLAGVLAQMQAVNRAWREKVAHLDKKYTEEEARRIWNATRDLMGHLAQQIAERIVQA